jgi:PIN domain nuclease of toxin-antitoxin system
MVIDSHTLLWWLEQSPKLSDAASKVLNGAENEGHTCYVAAATFWELYRKKVLGKLTPRVSVRRWPALLAPLNWLEVVDTTPAIWLATAELTWSHRDPADRLIAATASARGVSVLTKDRFFHASDSPVKAVW